MHIEQGWNRPARSGVALGGEPPRRHEQFAILTFHPPPEVQAQIPEIIHEVRHMIQHDFPIRVRSAFPSPLGLGLFEFDSTVQRQILLDASPIQFANGHIVVERHDEARNFRVCNYTRQCWIMLLCFPLDYQTTEFLSAAVAPFGRLLHWFEGPNRTRVLLECLILRPERVPQSVVLSRGSVLGGNGQSWSAACYILDGHFPDAFPPEEDPVPANGHPHPIHGAPLVNQNVAQHWQHEVAGAAQDIHADVGLNNEQMQEANEDLQIHPELEADDGFDDMEIDNGPAFPQHPDQPQDSISFDQSGSSAHYLRANGRDIVLNVEDVLAGIYGTNSADSSSSSSDSEVQSQPSLAFLRVESQAFQFMHAQLIQRPFTLPASLFHAIAQEESDQSLAIIPFRPSLHAVMIAIWAQAQGNMESEIIQNERIETPSSDSLPLDKSVEVPASNTERSEVESFPDDVTTTTDLCTARPVALPQVVSVSHPWASLEDSSVRRSARQSKAKDGFKYYQLEDHPRKKICVWSEVAVSPSDAGKLLANPPKPVDEFVPGQLPNDMLKTWGIACSIEPEDISDEALNQDPLPLVIHEDATD